MLKYYFRLLLLVGAIIGIFAVIGSLIPRSYDFSTQMEMSAPPEAIFPKINSLREWQDWSMQFNPALIDDLEIEYNGEQAGKGAAQSWMDIRGKGKLWITQSEPNSRIEYETKFANFPKMSSQIELQAAEGKTLVKWKSQGKLPGGPFYGYFGSFFSTQMENEYNKSLQKLKSVVESARNNSVDGEDSAPREVEDKQDG